MKLVSHTNQSKKFIENSCLQQRLQRLLQAGADVISAISGATEDELLLARKSCASLGWRTEVALDAALVNVSHAKRGRGNVDIDGVGVKAAIQKQAQAMKVSASTIKLNVRIFNTFLKNELNCRPNLTEKGYFQAALRHDNPERAIRYFDSQVSSKSDFSVSDAFRWASKKPEQLATATSPLADHIKWAKREIVRVKESCPDKKFGERFYDPLIQDLEDHLTYMSEEEHEQLCRKAWENGNHREGQLVKATGLDSKHVRAAMLRLSEQNEFWEVPETTHGRHDKFWQKSGVGFNPIKRAG